MLLFLFYWLLNQYVAVCLQNQFIPPANELPLHASESMKQIGVYQCPEDYRKFPDTEALLIHWQIEHHYLANTFSGLQTQEQQDWFNRFKIK